jgi:hypothetical protein
MWFLCGPVLLQCCVGYHMSKLYDDGHVACFKDILWPEMLLLPGLTRPVPLQVRHCQMFREKRHTISTPSSVRE